MRALWTAASGLSAQQLKMDLISNNVANVNSTGFKAQDASFEELLQGQYSTLPLTNEENGLTPRRGANDLRFANGVRAVHRSSDFAQGMLKATDQPFDLAIQGEGFFQLQKNPGSASAETVYSRDGHFHLDAQGNLVNDSGYFVLDSNGNPIQLNPASLQGASVSVDPQGNIFLKSNGQSNVVSSINYVLFSQSPDANLEPVGDNLFALKPSALPNAQRFTPAALVTNPQDKQRIGTVSQGMLELSNVDLAKSMTDLIQAQRAYGFNSKAVQTADQMMGMADNMLP